MTSAAIKKAVSTVSFRTGLTSGLVRLQFLIRIGRPDTFRILNYHRVNDFKDPFTIDSVSVTDFDNQMRYLSKNYHVLSLNDIYDRVSHHIPLPNQCLAITFDDGYADNYDFAWPILKKYDLPATIFLTAGCIDGQVPLWFDQVLSAFKTTAIKKFECPVTGTVFDIQTREQKLYTAHVMLEQLKQKDIDHRNKIAADILHELGISKTDKLHNTSTLLTWPQVKKMSVNNISFGSHTMTHPILACLTEEDLEWELAASMKLISENISKKVPFLAYPNGKNKDFTENAVQAVRQAGYKAALTTEPDTNTLSSDPFTWGRYKPWQDQVAQFSLALFLHGL